MQKPKLIFVHLKLINDYNNLGEGGWNDIIHCKKNKNDFLKKT